MEYQNKAMGPKGARPSDGCEEAGGSRIGVIDIGSNTVRLVVYDLIDGVPAIIFNEKVACGLGRSIASSGLLDGEAILLALSTVGRFIALAEEMQIVRLDMVATAAVREAANGGDFVDTVRRIYNHEVRVLSGEDEARYSGVGIRAGVPQANGLAGDFGGGSLEIVDVHPAEIGESATFPVGALRLLDSYDGNLLKMRREVSVLFRNSGLVKRGEERDFYAAGGTWRALARADIAFRRYPLSVIDHYAISPTHAKEVCRLIAKSSEEELRKIKGMPANRARMLPAAAVALEELIEAAHPKRIVFSAFGLREGLAFTHMPEQFRRLDPLIAVCRGIGGRRGRFPLHGDELMEWIGDLFDDESEIERRHRHAACLLSDIGWRGNPDHRAELILNDVLYAQFVGIDHPGRAFVALALFACYGGAETDQEAAVAVGLLNKQQRRLASVLGLALRLGHRLSGGTSGLLKRSTLRKRENELVLTLSRSDKHLVGAVVDKRLQALGRAIGRAARIELV